MINPFERITGRRNAGAGYRSNPFANSAYPGTQQSANPTTMDRFGPQPQNRQPPQPFPQQGNTFGPQQAAVSGYNPATQQGAVPNTQQRGPDRYGAPAPAPTPASQQPYGQDFSAQSGQSNPFMYNPQQRNQPHYGGQWWPGSGEMNMLLQGINPWGGMTNDQQQQWLQQVGPYLNVPQMTGSWSGSNELGRNFTAVNQADQAGGDVGMAFVNAWLGANKPQVSQNNYNARHQWEQSGAGEQQNQQWGYRYGWNP